jgi:hypothetical protein
VNASPRLLASVERLYETFSAYPLPRNTDPCPCCHNAEHDAILRSKPLRNLEPEGLRAYAFDAILTWGNETTFKHFLPRLFEVFVTISDPSLNFANPEILFSKFRHANWQTWADSEQVAVRDFLRSLWDDALRFDFRYDNDFEDTESCLCSVAQAEEDLMPYLDQWIETQTLEACLTLSGLILQSAVTLKRNAGRNNFWNGRDAQYQQLKNWVFSAAVAEKLERAALQWANTSSHDEFVAARTMLH